MDVVADDNGGVLTKYQNGLGIDDKLKVSINGTAKYFITDHLGSTVGLTNQSGAITEQTSYDSFGNAATNLSTRYQFTGREFDNFTGLQYSRARWYDAKTGRFVSEDPIGFGGGDVNLYGYVWNNSQNFVDPSGLDGEATGKSLQIPTTGGEPPRRGPCFITDLRNCGTPPTASPTPFATPSPSATPVPPAPPLTPPTSPSEPMLPCECQKLRTPDFYSGGLYLPIPQTLGIVKVGGSVTVDRYWQIYLTPGVQVGFPGPDASITAGYLVQECTPHPSETANYLTSWGLSAGGGAGFVYGGGVSSGGRAIFAGWGYKGFGVTGGYGFGPF